jgi:cytochrome P450
LDLCVAAVAFDPLVQDEPYAAYRELRAGAPLYRNEARGFWALSRFEDVQRAAREWTGFSSADGVNLDDTLSLTGPGNFIAADPPDHDRLRRVVRGRFTPAGVAAMEAAIRDDVRGVLAAAVRAGGFDAADALAWTIPVRTVSRLLGLPVEDEPTLGGWLRAVIHRDAERDRLPDSARAAAGELRAYLIAHLAQRRAAPGDDLLSDIVAGQARGELEEAELPGLCILLYVAGTETVADFIGNALVALAEHTDQRAARRPTRAGRRRGRGAPPIRVAGQLARRRRGTTSGLAAGGPRPAPREGIRATRDSWVR